MNSKPVPGNLITATHNLWNASSDINWIVGRLGVKTSVSTYDIDVVGSAGVVYVSLGNDGGLGQATALDAVGVAKTGWQMVRMRRENGSLVIREAEQYAGGDGGSSGSGATNLDALTDVTLTTLSNGQVLAYDSATGQWKNSSAGSGGATYTAGEAIDIDGSNVISVKRHAAGAVGVTSGALSINVGNGISIQSNALALNLASIPGLEFGTGSDAGKVQVKITDGIQRTGAGIGVKLKTTSGLEVDVNGLALADAIAGSGLVIASKVLAVGAGDGIDSNANDVAVDVTDFIDTAAGLKEDASNNIQVRLETNSALQFGGAGGIQLGTPSTLAYNSTNSVVSGTHSHAITSSSDVGTTPAQSLLSSTGAGGLTLGPLTLYGNITFGGGNRSILATNNITIFPNGDLILDPGGLILTPNAQDIRTNTINDLPTGIDGFRFWNRYANYNQLTIGAIKADEMYVRVFVADETRIDRGEEYWSKSFGIVQEDFTLPAIGATVDVWFEDAPAALHFLLFAYGDYLLMRTIDWGTGLVVQKVWWQVIAGVGLESSTPGVPGSIDRQKWQIQRIAGGINGSLIKRGNMMLDTGVVGQGWVHLSALSQDGGPFIQIGTMTSISTVPQFTNHVRMGNLNGTVDYTSNTWGIAAGSGSSGIGTAPSAGFSGFAAEGTNGLRLFNTSILMYTGGVLGTSITNTNGIRLLQDTVLDANPNRYIEWFSTLSPIADANRRGTIRSFQDTGRSGMQIYSLGGSAAEAYIEIGAQGNSKSVSLQFSTNSQTATFVTATTVSMLGNLGVGTNSPGARLHVKLDQNAPTEVYVENDSTGTAGQAGFTAEESGAIISVRKTGTGYTAYKLFAAGDGYLYNSVRGDIAILNDYASGSIKLAAGAASSPHLIILSNGVVGIGTSTPAATETSSRFTVSGSDAAALYGAIINTGAGQAGFALNRTGTTPSRWLLYVPGGADRLDFYAGNTSTGVMSLTSGGSVGIGTATPVATETFSRLTVSGSDATALYAAVINTGAGQAGIALNRTGTTPSRWIMYIPAAQDALQFYNTTAGGVMTLASTGQVRIGADSGALVGNASQLQVGAQDKQVIRATVYGSAAQFTLIGARAFGTAAAPSALTSGNVIMAIGALGYTSGGWSAGANGEIDFRATEDFNGGTTSKGGTEILFYTRLNSTSGSYEAMRLYHNGILDVDGVAGFNMGATGSAVYVRSDGLLGVQTSSLRFKRDIRALPDRYGDAFVMALEPVIYKSNPPMVDGVPSLEDEGDYAGFLAEAVDKAGGQLFVGYDKRGLAESLHYDKLTVPIVAALQGLIPYKARIAELEARISELERKLH